MESNSEAQHSEQKNDQQKPEADIHGIVDRGQSVKPRFELKVYAPKKFHARIIGAKGAMRRKLQEETNTQIIVPEIGSRSSNVYVKGNSKEDVLEGKRRIDGITKVRPPRQKYTHFVSISLASNEIKGNFVKFKEEVMSDPEYKDLHEYLFQTPEKLHITISMLVLDKEGDEEIAFTHLKECKEMFIDPVLQGEPLLLKVSGVKIFDDCKPSAVSVVFGEIEDDEKMRKIANDMARYFESCGLVKQERSEAKLHLTLINSALYKEAEEDDSEEGKLRLRQMKRKTFDASKLVETYKDFYFGELTVKDMNICKLGTVAENGSYEISGTLTL